MKDAFYPIIRIIEEDYEIPQLKRRRRIAALLPYDYEENDRYYPVLYLNDGQNLFNDNAPFGNWAIDHSLQDLAREGFRNLIIIAVDHGHEERINEYSPFDHPKFGVGQGKLYLQFLLETLKPYVDRKFRVLTDRDNTGIGGSSMGGLISLYAGMAYNQSFSRMLIFSPSLWIAPQIYDLSDRFLPQHPTYLYIYAGEKESHFHISNVKKLKFALHHRDADRSLLNLKLSINPEGTHNERFWAAEFPKALRWLYGQPAAASR